MTVSNHKYYEYEKLKSGRKYQRLLVQYLMNEYLNTDLSITKLRKIKKTKWKFKNTADGKQWESKEISYQVLDEYLMRHNSFEHQFFNLPEIKCPWLDGDLDIALDQHIVGSDNKALQIGLNMALGNNFPISPCIDREGSLYNSFQRPLLRRIVTLRDRLVVNSSDFKNEDWLFDLLSLVSNCVSIVEITLHRFHIKAEYDPIEVWDFDIQKVGERYNRRFVDKIKWVHQITGNVLDDIGSEIKTFNFLREIRNHTQHFDPPCFGFTLEEVASWLNMIKDIGMLLFKIRKKISSKINEDLIRLILLPNVVFNGIVLFDRERLPHTGGYKSTCWK